MVALTRDKSLANVVQSLARETEVKGMEIKQNIPYAQEKTAEIRQKNTKASVRES